MSAKKTNRRKLFAAVAAGAVGAAAVPVILALLLGRELVVGNNVREEDITDFYCTYAASSFPPYWEQYHFSALEGGYLFTYEKREGKHWPLTEEDTAISCSTELTEAEWTTLLEHLRDGRVEKRGSSAETGGSGPALYLYWQGDRGEYQVFTFASYAARVSFEEFCAALTERSN